MIVDSTVALCIDGRCTKCGDIGLAVCDALGNTAAREEPGLDIVRRPFCGVDAATNTIQASTIVVGNVCRIERRAAARVTVVIRITVRSFESPGLPAARDRASRICMQGHRVGKECVDAFDDVDLPIVRPVWANKPVCRPCAAPPGHVYKIQYEKAVSVRVVANDPDRRSTIPAIGPVVCRVDGHVGRRASLDEAILFGYSLVDVSETSQP